MAKKVWFSIWWLPPSWILQNINFAGKTSYATPFSVSMSNLVRIHSKMAELWPFNWFQNGGRRHLEFTSGDYFCHLVLFGYWLGMFLYNFITVAQYMADLLSFLKKYKMAAAAIMNCYLVTIDHPRSLLHGGKFVLKFRVNRLSIFRNMAIWKFWKFGLKCLFPPQNWRFWVVLTPKHYFSSSRPPKGTSLAETAHFEPLSVAIGPAALPVQRVKSTKKGRKIMWQTGY